MKVGKCHQRIIREKLEIQEANNLFGKYWEKLNLSKENAIVKEITRKEALPLILKYEWLGTLPVNFTKFVGLYFDNYLVGAACFHNTKISGKYSLFGYEAWCLGRGACVHFAPNWAGSFLVSSACKLLFNNKSPIYVVAYSDFDAGEIGTIYQACNWTFLGKIKTQVWKDKYGKDCSISPHTRAVTGFQRKKNPELRATKEQIKIELDKLIKNGYTKVKKERGKYAYVYGKKCGKKKIMQNILKENANKYLKRK
tara:strand:- start:367 stop:1128 length:762 start_codon:yes stop_codon:yes gene_type:complete